MERFNYRDSEFQSNENGIWVKYAEAKSKIKELYGIYKQKERFLYISIINLSLSSLVSIIHILVK